MLCVSILIIVLCLISWVRNGYFEFFENEERVVISLTTSPKRIETIETTLESLTNQSRKPNIIYLNIPERFGRTNETYVIPKFIEKYSLVKINRVEKDEGPITKLTPTIRLENDPNTVIIIVDDDTLYDSKLVERVLSEMKKAKDPNTVIANHCRYDTNKLPPPYCEVPEGWSGVGFRRSIFKDDFESYLKVALQNDKCVRSDDLIIGNYLDLHSVPKISVNYEPGVLWFAKENDALSIIDDDSANRYTPCRKHLKSNNIIAEAEL